MIKIKQFYIKMICGKLDKIDRVQYRCGNIVLEAEYTREPFVVGVDRGGSFFMNKSPWSRLTVDQLNKQISSVSNTMASYVKNADLMRKMIRSMGRDEPVAVSSIKKLVRQIPKPILKETTQAKKTTEIKKEIQKGNEQPVQKPSEIGMDYRNNPIFLKVAEYFGIDQKEYPNAVNKIAAIADWAVGETNSQNPSAVISKIAETSRSLQSPGMGERRYAILHRYIKLAEEGHTVDKAIGDQKNASPNLQAQKQDIAKEMAAYQTA